MPSETVKQHFASPNRKIWVYGILLLIILVAVAYYGLMDRKERSVNHDYYRVLYEASNTFKENLNKLDSMHRFREGVSSIRSLLPSYTGKPLSKNTDEVSFEYTIAAESIMVSSESLPEFSAQLTIQDVLPDPKKGFSQYLFADETGKVLARVGAERTISVVQLSSINEQIQRKSKQFKLNFGDPKDSQKTTDKPPLPSYSNHVDMTLSYGEFRVYVFPFSLDTPLQQAPGVKPQTLDKLYLVGLLPEHKLSNKDNGGWNLSLLIVSLVSLVFIWCMLRLYLLPKNQSITPAYRVLTSAAAYVFYIVLIGLILAYFQKSMLQDDKDSTALNYAKYLQLELSEDLHDVFSQLARFRDFYSHLLTALSDVQSTTDPYQTLTGEQISQFNSTVQTAIESLNKSQCDAQTKVPSWMPGAVGTAFKNYPINYVCEPEKNINTAQLELDQHAISVMLNAFQSNSKNAFTLAFYSKNQQIDLAPEKFLETSVKPGHVQSDEQKFLSVFALSKEGNSVLPTVTFQESNTLPTTFNLAHRDYYKKVRDQKGWDLSFVTEKNSATHTDNFNNVYIQRLLNVNNGTRGTTVSMPISAPEASSLYTMDYIIGADVMLPSMTLGQSPPYDFVYMVVERSSGNVLFHNDSERSLVENLYYTGDKHSPLSQWLKASLDHYSQLSKGLIRGTYHGQNGRFAISNSPINEWAVVVFYPNDSLQSYMTNQFLYIVTTFALLIALMVLAVYAIRHFVWTNSLKRKWNLPAKLNVRLVLLVSSILFGASYSLYILGDSLDSFISHSSSFNWSFWLPMIGLAIASIVVYRGCYNHFCVPTASLAQQTELSAKRGSKRLITVVLAAVAIHFIYLQKTADAPRTSLDFHYQQLACNWLNYERQELTTIGLSRYPNSITSGRIAPIDLLPLNKLWRDRLRNGSHHCATHPTQVHPDEYPSLSSVFGVTYAWQWINIYLFNQELTAIYQPQPNVKAFLQQQPSLDADVFIAVLGYTLLLATTLFVWFRFNTRVLWNRLYYPERFLAHIQRMTQSIRTLHFEERAKNLRIECDTIKLNGIGLALLLRNMVVKPIKQESSLMPGFDQLYDICPCLQRFSEENSFLPNLKINLQNNPQSNSLDVEIWDIETCLEKSQFRQCLLDLILELKSLALSKQIASFTIFTGFHSLQRVKMKDPLMLDQSALLDHAEYLAWAECLMDFVVDVPDSFYADVDQKLLRQEIAPFPELHYLLKECSNEPDDENDTPIWKADDQLKLESRWATINYILLNAEALYRFKWESCSSAEKLALLNLAKQRKLNPANTQMIEHLALNGLIRVHNGSLDIINRSFAHFVLHAETAATLHQLIQHGEAGVWKNYKLPLGILILLIIGGIALSSGESVYIIAASMAGILGTIASVTNSANLLRGQMKE